MIAKLDRVLFADHGETYKQHLYEEQWPNLEKYIEHYCNTERFRSYWFANQSPSEGTTQWADERFERYMAAKLEKAGYKFFEQGGNVRKS